MSARCVLALALLLPALCDAAVVEGRVVRDDRPVAGMRVGAHPALDPRSPAAAVALSDADGRYRLTLPDGRYAIFARSADDKLFAAGGRNPVDLSGAEPLWVGLQAVPAVPVRLAPYDDPYSGAVEGRVLLDGQPLAGAVVTLYLDSAELKGPGYRHSLPTGDDGAFVFDNLPEADYFVVARRRDGGRKVGPMPEGADFAWLPANPLHAPAGKTTRIELHATRKVREADAPEGLPADRPTLHGRVVDRNGGPAAGVHVFAYTDKVIGHKRPAALSAPTGADGRFRLVLPAAGLYYVGAREGYGDSPAPGERFGMYDESADHGIRVTTPPDAAELRIVVEPVTLD